MTDGALMYADIANQPQALESIITSLPEAWGQHGLDRIKAGSRGWVFTGCGTTYALGLSVAAVFRRQGLPAIAIPASEIVFYPESLPPGPAALLAFSRSGETSETLWALEAFRRLKPSEPVGAITCSLGSAIAAAADFVLSAAPAKDRSVVETQSFTGMLLAAQALLAELTGAPAGLDSLRKLPALVSRLMPLTQQAGEAIGRDPGLSRFFFLGSGLMYGLACQAAFTLKECSAEWTEAFHTLEFRHGPRTSAVAGAFVCLFLDETNPHQQEELKVAAEMKAQGARVLVLAEGVPSRQVPALSDGEWLQLNSSVSPAERLPLYLPFIQWLAYYRALASGKNPDQPANLHAVTKL